MYFQSQKQFSQVSNDNENEALIITKPERLSIVFLFRWWFLIRNGIQLSTEILFLRPMKELYIYADVTSVSNTSYCYSNLDASVFLYFEAEVFNFQLEVFKVFYKNKIMKMLLFKNCGPGMKKQ